jgi:hypothetical protein
MIRNAPDALAEKDVPMLAAILAFVIATVTALSNGTGDAPGLANASLPAAAVAELHSNAVEALANAGRPETLPAIQDGAIASEDVQIGEGQENQSDQPVVDTSNAPEEIDLGNVPAQENENANVPETVGANDHADLPDQAGGNAGDQGVAACANSGGSASGCDGS